MKKRRSAWEIVYKAMEYGAEVKLLDGNVYSVVDGKLCLRLLRWEDISKRDGPPDEILWVETSMTLNTFINYCESLSEEDLFSLTALNTLQSMKKKR